MKSHMNTMFVRHIALIALLVLLSSGSANGEPRQWGDAGMPIRQGKHIQWNRTSSTDSSGNVLIVWADLRTRVSNIYAQLITPAGTTPWGADGIAVAANPFMQVKPVAVAVNGGWVIVWADCRDDISPVNNLGDVWAQKLDAGGNRLWLENNATGVRVNLSTEAAITDLCVVHDGSGGAIVAWTDNRGVNQTDVRAQRITAQGTLQWQNHLNVTDCPGDQTGLVACSDGHGNALLAWTDRRTGFTSSDIYAAKVTAGGLSAWTLNGIVVNTESDWLNMPQICPDRHGGCYIAWHSGIPMDAFIKVQRIDSLGQRIFTTGEVTAFSTEPNFVEGVMHHLSPSVSGGQPDGCLIVWENYLPDGIVYYPEVWAQKIGENGICAWAENGIRIAGEIGLRHTATFPRALSDRNGGMVCIWTDNHFTESGIQSHIMASRINADGIPAWGQNGVIVCDDDGNQDVPEILLPDTSRVCAVWKGHHVNSSNLRFQFLDLTQGNRILASEGVEVVAGLDGNAEMMVSTVMSGGRTAFVWQESRSDAGDLQLYFQIVNDQGQVEKAVNGEMLISSAAATTDGVGTPSICPDGNGGFHVFWECSIAGESQVRLAHVNAAGSNQTGPDGVIILSHTGAVQFNGFKVATCTAGGCYLAWLEYQSDDMTHLLMQRLSAAYQLMWDEPLWINFTAESVSEPGLIPNPDGSCVLTWVSGNTPEMNIKSARILPDGTIAWSQDVCRAVDMELFPTAIPDADGGAFYVWEDLQDVAMQPSRVCAQHFNVDGQNLWPDEGVVVAVSTSPQTSPAICRDAQGNLFVVWVNCDSFSINNDLYMQQIGSNGARLWGDSGLPLCSLPGNQTQPQIAADHAGGFFAVWMDNRDGFGKIYATHLDATGIPVADPYWVIGGGGEACDLDFSMVGAELTSGTTTGNVICWRQREACSIPATDSYYDLGAQRFNDGFGNLRARENSSSLVTRYLLEQNYPNPFNPVTQIRFALPKAGNVSLKVYNTLGQEVMALINGKMDAGEHSVAFDGSTLSSGVYMYRLRIGEFDQCRKMVVLK